MSAQIEMKVVWSQKGVDEECTLMRFFEKYLLFWNMSKTEIAKDA